MGSKLIKKIIVERNNKVVAMTTETQSLRCSAGSKPSADIMNEALNLTRAEQAGINVPPLVEISSGNCWAVSARKVEGKSN